MNSKTKQLSELKSKLLENLENNILKFWVENTIDYENGGFIGLINDKNEKVKDSSKGAVLNTRILWTFSAACIHYKLDEYRNLADRAYNYISDFFIDKKYGGVYWELDYTGKPVNSRKQVYAQAFAVYSFVEYFKITKQKAILDKAIAIYHLIEKYSLDRKLGGYLDAFSED
jgi:mannobiose 2-epimerase